MNSYSKLLEEDRRLSILRVLADSAGYKANQFLLLQMLDEVFGHTISMDRLKADFAWLSEQGLLVVGEHGPVQVPMLTERGLDVASGRATTPGVKRPRPG